MSEQTNATAPSPWPLVIGGLLLAIAVVTVALGDANWRTAIAGVLGLGLVAFGLLRRRR